MTDLWQLLGNDEAVKALSSKKDGLSSLTATAESLILAAMFRQKPQMTVVIKNNLYSAQQLYRKLTPLVEEDVLLFAMEESLRVEAVASSPTMYADQMETLARLCLENKPRLIITHPSAIMRYLPTPECFRKHILSLHKGDTVKISELKHLLTESGYRYSNRVDQPLTYSARGDIIDVFTVQEDHPVRIEFFDDEIDSIRYFDLSSQRTVKHVDEIDIVPASLLIYDEDFKGIEKRINEQLERDVVKTDYPNDLKANISHDLEYLQSHVFEHYLYRYRCFYENNGNFLDYLDNPYVILSTADEIDTNVSRLMQETVDFVREIFEDGLGLCYFSLFADFSRIVDSMDCYRIASFADFKHQIKTGIEQVFFPSLPLNRAVEQIARMTENGNIIVAMDLERRKLLEETINEKHYDLPITYMDEIFEEGFSCSGTTVLTAKEIFGTAIRKGRYSQKFNEAQQLNDYQDLKKGDYVVHNQYGIGIYQGIVTREIRGMKRDFLQLLYRDDDELLVPLEQFRLVRKFIAGEGVGIRLNKIGSNAWKKNKEKIQADVEDLAGRLIELYSDRENNIGFAFSKDDELMKQFEQRVDFELTRDQKKAVEEVKKDMESQRPMDRLLCGDVGFGKTEVAMIAAFKAVKDLKQVAYLCPTTILSRQHYNSFSKRFRDFPVRIALLNRFVSEAEQKEILQQVKEGKIDILIGTHRLLSQDVVFEDLGLLIIDEEQRFGVQAKEKIKELKRTIDVLSLSATPIPRTLQMSLVGIMSLSQLDTAPRNRMPIQTYVVEKNQSLVKEVIQRELARQGQVFYLHNNVQTIYEVAAKLEIDLPQAHVGVAHGQMNREEIEDVMYRFVSGEYDILVCTTIIETGIDISNANTIIIDKADNFGLSQLYQIRGRVGRSDRIAYAYLMYNPSRQLSEVATKRLQAIKDFTELGSGYKIAMRDLTIRGAGDLLGEKQAGFINTVGMDLYLEMLQQAIKEKKGLAVKEEERPKNQVSDAGGYIPENFAPQDWEKIELYQRIDKASTLKSLQLLQEEISDRYGKLPDSVRLLFEKKRVELLLNSRYFDTFEELPREIRLVITAEYSQQVDGIKLFESLMNLSKDITLKYTQGRITVRIPRRKNWLHLVNECIKAVEESERKPA